MLKRLGKSNFVLVVETQNIKSGLGARFGTWLLERGYRTRYAHLGSAKEGRGGLSEQIPYQGLGTEDIKQKVKELI
jgi:transketolase C-terminal domain/subunit